MIPGTSNGPGPPDTSNDCRRSPGTGPADSAADPIIHKVVLALALSNIILVLVLHCMPETRIIPALALRLAPAGHWHRHLRVARAAAAAAAAACDCQVGLGPARRDQHQQIDPQLFLISPLIFNYFNFS